MVFFPVLGPGFAQDLQAVGNGLDPRIGPAAHGKGLEEEEDHAARAEGGQPGLEIRSDLAGNGADLGKVGR